jgi:mediator of DNA damage checkpoint protein 1
MWLEDCFIQWRNLSVGLEKYVVFPPGLDFSDHLGERGIQREVILETLPDLVAEMALAQGKAVSVDEVPNHRDEENTSQLTPKRLNARKANKAKDATGSSNTEDRMDVDAQLGSQGVGRDHMQADKPATPRRVAQKPGPKRAWNSSEKPSTSHSQLEQHTSPLRPTNDDSLSGTRCHRRADSETARDEHIPSPTGKSTCHPTTPIPMDSDLVPPKGTARVPGRSPLKKASPVKTKPKSHASHSATISGEHTHPLSSLTVDISTDREEGPSRHTSRRSAANKATQRLREEVMPDVVNFEKELRRGNVRAAALPESKRGKERNDVVSRTVGKGKKRASIHPVESAASSDDEHERKKRRLSGAKGKDRSADMRDDDERADRGQTSSQETAEILSHKGRTKGAKLKKGSSGGDLRQAISIPRSQLCSLTDRPK